MYPVPSLHDFIQFDQQHKGQPLHAHWSATVSKRNHSLDFNLTTTIHATISHTYSSTINGSPLSTTILPTGTMPLMPFSDSSLITKPQPTATQQRRPPHPHPLRSHRSSENILAQQSSQPNTISDFNPFRTTINFSRTYLPTRTMRRGSVDASSSRETFTSPKMAAAVFPTEKRFCYASRTYEQRNDYPVIPIRPPLRPTVSFGSASVATFTSHDSIWEEKNRAATNDPPHPKKRGCLGAFSSLISSCRGG
ncbi:hypothetical protein AC579_4337 [Pseudocercospora musae]|uniref:Uncharacterized protein n=1 Tax=Pseudocercospora musae TaxID=113226 RepID=A0A139IQK9_9PEZI|nr:hypothetical protein AC579_4337 [Pseudocercospora musae]